MLILARFERGQRRQADKTGHADRGFIVVGRDTICTGAGAKVYFTFEIPINSTGSCSARGCYLLQPSGVRFQAHRLWSSHPRAAAAVRLEDQFTVVNKAKAAFRVGQCIVLDHRADASGSVAGRRRNFLRAGILKKIFSTEIIVPTVYRHSIVMLPCRPQAGVGCRSPRLHDGLSS